MKIIISQFHSLMLIENIIVDDFFIVKLNFCSYIFVSVYFQNYYSVINMLADQQYILTYHTAKKLAKWLET